MPEVMIIADDLTGALDTGVQFSSRGIATAVALNANGAFDGMPESLRVLAVNAETRHLCPKDAYQTVYEIARRAVRAGIRCLLKKTDSALRGNVGSELEAVFKASGVRCLPFIPAYPKLGRTTRGGVQRIDGVPLHESVFAQDAFEPVRDSSIPAIIARQSQIPVACADGLGEGKNGAFDLSEYSGIQVFDCETDAQLDQIIAALRWPGEIIALAGCAGCAAAVARQVRRDGESMPNRGKAAEGGILVVSGSLNPIANRQIARAIESGFGGVLLENLSCKDERGFEMYQNSCLFPEIRRNLQQKKACAVWPKMPQGEIADHDRLLAAERLGKMTKRALESFPGITVFVIGGDTLKGVLKQMDCGWVRPLYEILPGTVLFQPSGGTNPMICKSGGFGDENLLVEVRRALKNH